MSLTNDLASLVTDPAHVIDDVKPLTLGDYYRATDYYVRGMALHRGTRYIAQFGSVNTPGVSDIDILVITDDATYTSACEKSRQLTYEAPNGSYLFAHPAAVVPVSLLPAFRIVHTLADLRPLWGGPQALDAVTPPSYPLAELNAIVWNSAFLRYTLYHRRGRWGLRNLLLMLGNMVQSIAANYRMLGRDHGISETIRWGKADARYRVLAAPANARCEIVHRYLVEGLARWMDSDWQVEEWWSRNVRPGDAVSVHGVTAAVDHVTEFRFSRAEGSSAPLSTSRLGFRRAWQSVCASHSTASPLRRAMDVARAVKWPYSSVAVVTLPLLYLDVAFALRSAYEPGFSRVFSAPGTSSSQGRFGHDDWDRAAETYIGAVRSISEFARRNGEADLSVYGVRIMTPFGL